MTDFDQVSYDDLFTLAEALRLAHKDHERRLKALKRSEGGRNWKANENQQGFVQWRLARTDAMRERVASELQRRNRQR